jgi:hypothetical protein
MEISAGMNGNVIRLERALLAPRAIELGLSLFRRPSWIVRASMDNMCLPHRGTFAGWCVNNKHATFKTVTGLSGANLSTVLFGGECACIPFFDENMARRTRR